MDIPIHNHIIWEACDEARKRGRLSVDPRTVFPLIARGSWLTDTNQATQVTNLAPKPLEGGFRRFLRELWRADSEELVAAFGSPRAPQSAREVAAEMLAARDQIPDHVDDFGSYDPHDHHDVLDAGRAAAESQGAADGKPSPTIRRSVDHALDLLAMCSMGSPNDRYDWSNLTTLGRALHTLQDYFAHSNHVELLLWSLRPELTDRFVGAFHDGASFLESTGNERCYCPSLPRENEALTRKNTMFWYGSSPESTPLVSTLFDTRDTLCSLLDIHRANLEDVHGKRIDPDDLNLILSVFDVPGRRIAVGAFRVYEAFSDFLASAGEAVRGWMAKELRERAGEAKDSSVGDALRTGAQLLVDYDSDEAKEWARAGRLKYLIYTLRRGMAEELSREEGDGEFKLPHHTLLCKDHEMAGEADAWRFRLAALLATEMTTEVLRWYFAPNPDMGDARAIIGRYVRHPAHAQTTWTPTRRRDAAQCIETITRGRWSRNVGEARGIFA